MKNKYYVTLKVDARYTAEVEAESIDEAKKFAENKWSDANLNDLEINDSKPIIVENSDGDIIWER